jgi:hypothetical protein
MQTKVARMGAENLISYLNQANAEICRYFQYEIKQICFNQGCSVAKKGKSLVGQDSNSTQRAGINVYASTNSTGSHQRHSKCQRFFGMF